MQFKTNQEALSRYLEKLDLNINEVTRWLKNILMLKENKK